MKNLRFFRVIISQKLASDTVPAIYHLHINDYDNLFRYRNCEELIRRDALESRFVQLKKKQEESSQIASTENDGLKSQLEEMKLKKLEFEIENSDLKDELQQAKNDNYGLQSQLDSIQAAYEPLKKGKEAYDLVRQIDEYPKTPKDIPEFFVTVFSDRIDLTEKGWKSLKDCGTAPAVLWEVLFSMGQLCMIVLENITILWKLVQNTTNKLRLSVFPEILLRQKKTKQYQENMKTTTLKMR
ncbi:hypothetical protein ACTM9V_15770 [Oliverpabstia intestinalis]|uniref:hypothetical protein n=1 Tax=Oliverpabstia intestinalis TaxID=2606633 RepID=UPI003F8BDA4B